MDKEKLKKTVVFRGMEDDELDAALAALGAAAGRLSERRTDRPFQGAR